MYLLNSVLLGLSVLATFAIADFTPGWCGLHVIQYQKNELSGPASGNYQYMFDICVYDGAQVLLNQRLWPNKRCALTHGPDGTTQLVDEALLPFDLTITIGAVDDDPILFSYHGQNWGSNDQEHHSNFGAYDGGKRQGDTGFNC